MSEKPTTLDRLNPLKDMNDVKSRGGDGLITVAYRNLFRGALAGTLAGLAVDNTVGNGGFDLALFMGACAAIADFTQGLGRGAIQITNGNKSN